MHREELGEHKSLQSCLYGATNCSEVRRSGVFDRWRDTDRNQFLKRLSVSWRKHSHHTSKFSGWPSTTWRSTFQTLRDRSRQSDFSNRPTPPTQEKISQPHCTSNSCSSTTLTIPIPHVRRPPQLLASFAELSDQLHIGSPVVRAGLTVRTDSGVQIRYNRSAPLPKGLNAHWFPPGVAKPARRFLDWRIAGLATITGAMTGPGQTIGVSVSIDALIAELGLSRPQVSAAHLIGTLAGAAVCSSSYRSGTSASSTAPPISISDPTATTA